MADQMTRREAIRATAAAIGGSAAAIGGSAITMARNNAVASMSAGKPPNIIFILADDLGYGDLGCYGQKQILTPHLDRFASEGMKFTQAYAGSTVCAPSRCCLMTGLHTGHARVRGNARVPLLPEDVTVAEVLKTAGYVTGLVGKWGLGEPNTTGIPNRQGFDEWFGYLNQRNAHNYYPPYLWRNEERIRLEGNGPEYDLYDPEAAKQQFSSKGSRSQYSHDLFTTEALDFVKRHHAKPFFLYLAYTIPHANNEGGRASGDGMEVPDYGPYVDKPWPKQQKGHAAMITRMDRDIGKLMALLEKLGIDDNTVVVFTSDNGPHREGGAKPDFFDCNGPLKGIKRDLYEGGIRVPTMARWPSRIKPGSVSDHAWAFWDFLPTAAELAGAKSPTGIDGISIAPTLLGKTQKKPEYLYWEFHERGFTQAVRMGNYKAVRKGTKRAVELYDLSTDIGETRDIAKKHPDVVAKIESILDTARTDSKEFPIGERRRRAKKSKPGK